MFMRKKRTFVIVLLTLVFALSGCKSPKEEITFEGKEAIFVYLEEPEEYFKLGKYQGIAEPYEEKVISTQEYDLAINQYLDSHRFDDSVKESVVQEDSVLNGDIHIIEKNGEKTDGWIQDEEIHLTKENAKLNCIRFPVGILYGYKKEETVKVEGVWEFEKQCDDIILEEGDAVTCEIRINDIYQEKKHTLDSLALSEPDCQNAEELKEKICKEYRDSVNKDSLLEYKNEVFTLGISNMTEKKEIPKELIRHNEECLWSEYKMYEKKNGKKTHVDESVIHYLTLQRMQKRAFIDLVLLQEGYQEEGFRDKYQAELEQIESILAEARASNDSQKLKDAESLAEELKSEYLEEYKEEVVFEILLRKEKINEK